MRRHLLVALWPAGLAAIAAATVIAARRAPVSPAPVSPGPAAGDQDQAAAEPADSADQAGRDGGPLSVPAGTGEPGNAGPASGVAGIRGTLGWPSVPAAARPDWVPGLIRLGAIGGAGGIVSYGVMALLGPPVVNHGLAIDEPVFRWTNSHQVDWWAAVMWRLNKVGDTWTTWGAAGAAAVCLGVSWRKQRWLPPAALGTAMLVDHYATGTLQRTFNRLGPPTNPLGTYPSGGTDRVVLFHGLIAHMLWREFSGSRRGKIWAIGAVTALSFSQAYCREYLSQHWFTDIISGLLYGVALLVPFIAAVRLIAGPAGVEAERRRTGLAAAPA
ncbi:MAG: hypothetical protein ABSB01_09370 [Streptosporangiaceae bacterium]|jgi:hypothetical protein